MKKGDIKIKKEVAFIRRPSMKYLQGKNIVTLKKWKNKYKKHWKQYPVIHMDWKGVSSIKTYCGVKSHLASQILSCYNKFPFLSDQKQYVNAMDRL